MSVTADLAPAELERDLRPWTTEQRSAEDQLVWRTMVDRIEAIVVESTRHHDCYRTAFSQIVAWRDEIPTLAQINAWLEPTGWRTTFVDGYVPVGLYQQLQAERIFPISWRLRRARDMDHSASPDFVHDVLGHLPMLFHAGYSALVQEWSARGMDARPTDADRAASKALTGLLEAFERPVVNPQEIAGRTEWLLRTQQAAIAESSRHFMFETFYTWAIEFGFLRNGDRPPILIGAAALSSPGEMIRLFSGDVTLQPFSQGAVGRPVNYTRYQDTMFLADDFDDYFTALRAI